MSAQSNTHRRTASLLVSMTLLATGCQLETETVSGSSNGDPTDATIGSSTGQNTSSADLSGTLSESETSTTTLDTTGSTTAGSGSTEPGVCGDGEVQGDETCDDGNDENNDTCPNTCLAPECGDGYVAPDEECDDGNENNEDGCNNVCARDRVVFITSESYGGDLSGITGAINRCRQRAFEAELENAMNFRPWLSSSESSPSTDFFRANGRYILTTGTKVADNWNDLVDGDLDAAIIRDEHGNLGENVITWTNTTPLGTPHPDGHHCEGWTSGSAIVPGRFGLSTSADDGWTLFGDATSCDSPARLYCFEQ